MKIYKNDDGIEVWEVTKEDFEITCHQGALISNIENTDIPFYYYFSFNSEDLCSIPNKIEIYKKGESSIDHIQYFPIALISECLWDLVGWHEIQLRNLYGIKKHLEHTFDDWQGGSSYYHEFVPLSFQESISISSPNSDTYFGSYYFKNFMSKKERNKIYEKQKELFKDYVEDLTEKFKWHFLDNLDNTPLIKDKKSLLKRKKKFLKEVLVNPDIQANGIISIENRNYGSMIFGDGENEKLVPHHCDYQIFLNNHQLKRLKELYKNNFLGGDGIFYYGFVKCPHFYKQSNKNEELEILCFALFNFRSWLLKLDIKNIRETKLVGTTIHKYKSVLLIIYQLKIKTRFGIIYYLSLKFARITLLNP